MERRRTPSEGMGSLVVVWMLALVGVTARGLLRGRCMHSRLQRDEPVPVCVVDLERDVVDREVFVE